MAQRDTPWRTGLALSIGLALSVFLADVVLPVGVVVGIPYVVVVVIASCFLRWGTVVGLALGCTGLTLLGFFGSPPFEFIRARHEPRALLHLLQLVEDCLYIPGVIGILAG